MMLIYFGNIDRIRKYFGILWHFNGVINDERKESLLHILLDGSESNVHDFFEESGD